MLESLPFFSTIAKAGANGGAQSAGPSKSGENYAAMNSPFNVGGSAGGWQGMVEKVAPWIVVGVIAFFVIKKG